MEEQLIDKITRLLVGIRDKYNLDAAFSIQSTVEYGMSYVLYVEKTSNSFKIFKDLDSLVNKLEHLYSADIGTEIMQRELDDLISERNMLDSHINKLTSVLNGGN